MSDVVGAELLDVSRDNFRQKLSRARRELTQFMDGQCGLVNASNPCRCAKKTQAFIRAGYLDPHKLIFVKPHLDRVRELAPKSTRTSNHSMPPTQRFIANIRFSRGPDFVPPRFAASFRTRWRETEMRDRRLSLLAARSPRAVAHGVSLRNGSRRLFAGRDRRAGKRRARSMGQRRPAGLLRTHGVRGNVLRPEYREADRRPRGLSAISRRLPGRSRSSASR